MKFLIAGAGAIGAHYGSLLQQAGSEVHLLARGPHLAAMQDEGLRHESMGQEKLVQVQAGDDPAAVRDADVVVFTCKMTGLVAICEALQPHMPPNAVLLTLLNGVTAPEVVRGYFPEHAILAGSAFIGARIEAPGHVIHSAAGHLRMGAWHAADASSLTAVVDAFRKSGIDCDAVDDQRRMMWNKMLWNCGFNAITALTRRHARDMARDPSVSVMVRDAMEEVRAVAVALGVTLEEHDIERQLQVSRELGPVKTSMWQDIEVGRPTEIDAMNGFVAAQAAQLNLQAPVNRLLAVLIRALEGR